MYNRKKIDELVHFIASHDGIGSKDRLEQLVQDTFCLVRQRSVYYCEWFAIRFCSASSRSFSNTVLALSTLHQYDHLPFVVCLVTPSQNYLMLANTTFLKKISHSSKALRVDNIRGSFNGGDILQTFEGIDNIPEHFEFLFTSHENYTFEENLVRLVEATNQIVPTGHRFIPSELKVSTIFSPQLLAGTRIMEHWAGRNSRGVTQYDGTALEAIVENFSYDIDPDAAQDFLTRCLDR